VTDTLQWLLESGEPWVRYRTLVDLLDRAEDDPEATTVRADMLAHPRVQAMQETPLAVAYLSGVAGS